MVARWRPVHLGHALVLHALCDAADHATIAIGSANRYNARNPFTLDETRAMIQGVLAGRDNYTLVPVDDFDDGPRWRDMVQGLLGELNLFVTDNPYVARLMANRYRVIRPVTLISPEKRLPLDGRQVRRAMAQGLPWQHLVPPSVAAYITEHGLDTRFRREFGLETLVLDAIDGD
jgi:nicotinamide-nucleotide adenylyltransferase